MDLLEAISKRSEDDKVENVLSSMEKEYPDCINWYLSRGDDVQFELIFTENNCDINLTMTPECLFEFRLKYL